MQSVATGSVNITGVLIGRHYKPGQKYIQLLFKTAGGMHLSLTRDMRMAKALAVGETYKVAGKQYARDGKKFILEPLATLVVQPVVRSKKRTRVMVSAAIAVIVMAGAGMTVFAATMSRATPEPNPAPSKKSDSIPAVTVPETSEVVQVEPSQAVPSNTSVESSDVRNEPVAAPRRATPVIQSRTPSLSPPPAAIDNAPAVSTPILPEEPVKEPMPADPDLPSSEGGSQTEPPAEAAPLPPQEPAPSTDPVNDPVVQ
ncbi:MAG TPA: hypothetical protein VK983_05460 [Candidatus Limnocylindrales bacterium]|nr:hypothetical protein [Candidatus Limnocylindrales bacterium]